MKKLLSIFMICLLSISIVGCNSNDTKEDTNVSIERTVDATAKALGLKNGETTMFQFIHATDGKSYDDGKVEIYQYKSEDDENYIDITKGQGFITPVDYKNGIVIVFVNDYKNDELLKKFKEIKYK